MPRSPSATAVVALAAVGAVLAGRGSSATAGGGGGAPGGAQDPNAPFEVWTRSTEATAKVSGKFFDDFEAKTGVKVDHKPISADFDKQIQQRAAAKDLPDLAVTDTGALGVFTSQGLVGEIDKGGVAVGADETVKSVGYLKKMFCGDPKVVQPGALTTGTNDAHAFFETGKTGIHVTGPYVFGRFDKNLGKDEYEVVAAPKGPAGDTVLGKLAENLKKELRTQGMSK
jgi:ABC-type glycerol-3-phosphate transport system substrate-binding protein